MNKSDKKLENPDRISMNVNIEEIDIVTRLM